MNEQRTPRTQPQAPAPGDHHPHVEQQTLPPLAGHHMTQRFIKHAQAPCNQGRLSDPDGTAVGVGSCGDSIELFLAIRDQRIQDIRHHPRGCLYTVACASAMTHLVKGRTLEKALTLTPEAVAEELGGLPEDHTHCAALAVNTLGEAIDAFYQTQWGNRHTPQQQGDETPCPSTR